MLAYVDAEHVHAHSSFSGLFAAQQFQHENIPASTDLRRHGVIGRHIVVGLPAAAGGGAVGMLLSTERLFPLAKLVGMPRPALSDQSTRGVYV